MAVQNKIFARSAWMVLLLSLGLSTQAHALQLHAQEVSRINFTDASGSFEEHGFALLKELSNDSQTVYAEFNLQGNAVLGQISAHQFAFNLWSVTGLSTFGFNEAGLAAVNNYDNTPVSLGTTTLIGGSIGQSNEPPALTAYLSGTFTPTAAAIGLFNLSASSYDVTGEFLHYLIDDVSPILANPADPYSPTIGFLVHDIAARDVITFTAAVPLPGSIWLFASALVAGLGSKMSRRHRA